MLINGLSLSDLTFRGLSYDSMKKKELHFLFEINEDFPWIKRKIFKLENFTGYSLDLDGAYSLMLCL